MRIRSCLGSSIYIAILILIFGVSSYSWFKFFVRGKSIPTPNLIGRSLDDARALTSDLGLLIVVDNTRDRHSEPVPPGSVVWQNRAAGTLVKRGTKLYVGQSLGPLVLQVPDLVGESPRTALLRFSQRNLKLGNLTYVETAATPGIVSEDPPRGTVVKGGTPVSLLVGFASPPSQFVMPDIIDLPLAEVRPALESRGLRISNVKFESYPGISDGIIIRQYPLPGAPVSSRDAITVVVSQEESGVFDQQQPVDQQQQPTEVPVPIPEATQTDTNATPP
jgi:beta-lactam-binding protein with PASTA domain